MTLLTPGYFPATYWTEDYWDDDYWQYFQISVFKGERIARDSIINQMIIKNSIINQTIALNSLIEIVEDT
jgi:hypothetical protein